MEKLLEILNDINPDVDYSKEKNLIDGKVYDSFSIITLVSNISEEFDIEIANEEAEKIVTVGDAVEQIKNAMN